MLRQILILTVALSTGACNRNAVDNPDLGQRDGTPGPKPERAVLDVAAVDGPSRDAPRSHDARQDTKAQRDLPTKADLTVQFPDVLAGIWLIGWSGGMNHFSWVRFTNNTASGGTADLLSGKGLLSNTPLWDCSGKGSFIITAKLDTIMLEFPKTCSGSPLESYSFSNFGPAGSYPKGATLSAKVELNGPGTMLDGFRFPLSQCDATMTTCTDPLK